MNIARETADQIVVLTPRARIDSATAKEFEEELLAAVEDGGGSVVVDFANLDYISSAGLRSVLVGAKTAKGKGGKLVLCGMKSHIRKVFDTSGFAKILPIVPDRRDALTVL